MPLDNTDFISENDQKLLHLAWRLRDRDFDFAWDYRGCGTCAIALGKEILGIGAWGNDFGLSEEDFMRIFIRAGRVVDKRMKDVQPEDVAEVIEQLVAAKVAA